MYFVIGLIAILVVTLLYLFPVMRVIGPSMLPTLYDKQWAIGTRIPILLKRPMKLGKIYVYQSPVKMETGTFVVKRLFALDKTADGENVAFFYGDNAAKSVDSKDYGYVLVKSVVARVIVVFM